MYKQITDQIKLAIATGSLAPLSKLPSIKEMSEKLGVSAITIRRAYAELESSRLIFTRPGLGSFVSSSSQESLRAQKASEIREQFQKLIESARECGVSLVEIESLIEGLKKEEQIND